MGGSIVASYLRHRDSGPTPMPVTAVNHYLISKSDVNMACSLDVFLGEKSFFSTLLQTIPSFDAEMRWARVEKAKAFGKSFVGVRVDGYDESLAVARRADAK